MTLLRAAALCTTLVMIGCGSGERAAPSAEPAEPAAKPAAPEIADQPSELAAPVAKELPGEGCATVEACAEAASAEERAGRLDRAAPLYSRACDLGSPQACARLGELYRDGKGVPPDDARARELFERGCREGSTAACDALGH